VNTLLALSGHAARYRSRGGYGDWLIFHWLWLRFRWWSIAIYFGGAVVLGVLKGVAQYVFGIGD
jgi:hypothetical protein